MTDRVSTVQAEGLLTILAGFVAEASDGAVTAAELTAAADTPFVALGIGSLAQLRLVDAVEERFEVFLDLDGGGDFLRSLGALAEHLAVGHGVAGPGGS
ncbi:MULTISPECIES: phosphopantetheine-binding protein [unclassified Kitasatospora]|uniref:phosphopantetheine-binding protein n=1 Tax=unclassified Kitasatospora TaxID=2633591 RepID=UPI00381FC6FE